MKKKSTLTQQRKRMKNNRHAISGILEALLLISMVTVGLAIVGVGISQINLENISCDVTMLEINEIGNNEYWVDSILFNNGDYTFNATLKYFDELTIKNLKHDGLNNIRPGNTTSMEFQFTGVIGDSVTMGFDVTDNDQQTFCIKEVRV